MTQQIQVGATVKVIAHHGGLFYSHNANKTGTVTKVDRDSSIVTVQFNTGTDYGNFRDVEVVTTAPAAGKAAKNGMAVGDRVKVNTEERKRGSFYTHRMGLTGTIVSILAGGDAISVDFDDGKNDCGYTTGVTLVERGLANGWIENTGTMPVPRDTLIDVKYKDGLVMLNLGAGSLDYEKATVVAGTGHRSGKRYARDWTIGQQAGTITHYRLALPVVTGVTLEAQLASLRTQHNAIKAEKQAAEAEVAAARAKVNEIEARRVALVSVLTTNGLQFAE